MKSGYSEGEGIELDLRSVERADTTLLASLVELVRQARRAGVDLVIQASASVRDLVEVCRLDPLITDCSRIDHGLILVIGAVWPGVVEGGRRRSEKTARI